jgi:hypothetical protein
VTPATETPKRGRGRRGSDDIGSSLSPRRTRTHRSRVVARLSIAAGALGVISAVAGLSWRECGAPTVAVTFLGEVVDLYGRGLYENDTLFFAANNLATDIVLLTLAAPLLVVVLARYLRGSMAGQLLLLGVLGFFLYYGATYALGGVAYNELFLVYVGLLSASLFGFIQVFTSFDHATLDRTFSGSVPRRLPGFFLIGSGAATFAIWLMEPLASVISGEPPKSLDTHTTLFTHAFDLAIIVPTALLAGVMILRRRPFGYVIAFSLLVLEALLLPIIAIATALQMNMGIEFTPAEIVGPIAGFAVLAIMSLWVMRATLRAGWSERQGETA